MNRKFIIITAVLAVVSFCVPLAIVLGWSRYFVRRDQVADYESAQQLLESQPDLALKLAHDHNQDGEGAAILPEQWQLIELQAWTQLRQIPQLMWMHNSSPELFDKSEEATTIVLRALQESGVISEPKRFATTGEVKKKTPQSGWPMTPTSSFVPTSHTSRQSCSNPMNSLPNKTASDFLVSLC
jgi:hypothetical protein